MTNYEDFFTFGYPALLIASGLLVSIIPGYIASRRNKSFWGWWLLSASIFAIVSIVVIKAQMFSALIYLLGTFPVLSLLAMSSKQIPIPKMTMSKDVLFFLGILLVLLVFGIALYLYLLSPGRSFLGDIETIYFVNLGLMILVACIGFASFILMVSERSVREIVGGIFLTFLFASPIFLDSSRAYTLVFLPGRLLGKDLLLGPVVTDLINMPIAGVFILLGICSGCTTIVIMLNDKYRVVNKIIPLLQSSDFSPPRIHFSKNPFLPVKILAIVLPYLAFFKVFFHPSEGWMFLIPLVFLCLLLPMYLLTFVGTALSSVVIVMSVSQKKFLYGLGILLCGVLAGWGGTSIRLFRNFFGSLGTLLMFYGVTSGLIALILWAISDLRRQN